MGKSKNQKAKGKVALQISNRIPREKGSFKSGQAASGLLMAKVGQASGLPMATGTVAPQTVAPL